MGGFWDKLELFLFKERDDGTEYIASSEPMGDPYSHKPQRCAVMTHGGKKYSVALTEIDP